MDAVQPGTVIAGRYTVTGEIGRGGMGIVYLVEHVHTGEKLALKVLSGPARSDPQAIARFKREARASTQIRSEHVVRVTDADTAPELDGSPFLVMELLKGVDLEQYVVRSGPLAPEQLVPLLAQVARALQTAHQHGVVHRDLKPENLFLHERDDGSTIAKVLDFGISKFVTNEAAIETAGMTSTGAVLGTPLYMAPEQAHAQNDKIAPTTDVWAMGLLTLRLLMGEHYWGVPTMAELMMRIAVKPIIPPSERWPGHPLMSPKLDEWFLRSCDRDQTKRFPSVEKQIAELASILGIEIPASQKVARSADGLPMSSHVAPHSNGASKTDSEDDDASELADTEESSLGADDVAREARSSRDPIAVTASENALTQSQPARPQQRSRTVVIGGVAIAAVLGTFAVMSLRETGSSKEATTALAGSSAPPIGSSPIVSSPINSSAPLDPVAPALPSPAALVSAVASSTLTAASAPAPLSSATNAATPTKLIKSAHPLTAPSAVPSASTQATPAPKAKRHPLDDQN